MEGQAQGRCGLVDAATVDQGPQAVRDRIAALRAEGWRYVVLDAISDAHTGDLGQAVADMAWSTAGRGWDTDRAGGVSGGADARPRTRARRWRGLRW